MNEELKKHILTLARKAAEHNPACIDQAPSKSALEYATAARELADIASYYMPQMELCPVNPCCGQPDNCTMRGGVDGN